MSTALVDHGMGLFFPSAGGAPPPPVYADIELATSTFPDTFNKSSGTTLTKTAFDDAAVGDLIVVAIACDNASASTPTVTVADNSNQPGTANTYTVVTRNSGQASASAGLALHVAYCFVTRPIVANTTVLTVTFSNAITAKALTSQTFRYASALRGSAYVASATTGTAASVAIANPVDQDLVVGTIAHESSTAITGDSDTTNGTWSTASVFATTGGSGATNVRGIIQAKVVTAAGSQTYNATVTSGDWCAIGLTFTPALAVAPNAPSTPVPTAGNGEVSLSWAAPSVTGGKAVSDYAVRYSSNGGSSWTSAPNVGSAATSTVVTGLTNGVGYIFQVAAVNTVGTGAWSSSSSSVTPTATSKLAPTDDFSAGSIDTVKWDSVSGGTGINASRLALTFASTYAIVNRTTAQDARSKEATLRVDALSRSMVTADETRLLIYDSTNINNRVEIGVYEQNLWFGVYAGGSIVHQAAWPSSVTYDGSTNRWLRLAFASDGAVSAYYGPDGSSWTQLGATSGALSWANSAYIRVDAGNYNGTTGTTAYIDDVNV